MKLRTPQAADVTAMWRINEESLPGVGEVSEAALADLLSLSEFPLSAFDGDEMLGFVLCLPPDTPYASPNYGWFNRRYTNFLYVDRIAVARSHRDRQVGTSLYAQVIAHADKYQWPVMAEVGLRPRNPGSLRFHGRHDFAEVGVLDHGHQSVTMLMRDYR